MKREFVPRADLLPADLSGARRVAASVRKLSDWFIANPTGHTPWDQPWAVEAYLGYYLPLNELRVRAVITEGRAVGFFAGLDRVIDYGAGPATASRALRAELPGFKSFRLIERSAVPARLVDDPDFSFATELRPADFAEPARTLFVASYSLTEGELPKDALKSEALMLIEPSTQDDGRRLLELRRSLLEAGYFAWAPCPHQGDCPLLTQSPRDWCHDRVHVARTDWFATVESFLPFRNQTVTFSYVLMRRTPAPAAPWARLVGDRLEEKGKDRQMVCRGPQREFLAWLNKQGPTPDLPRGARVRLPAEIKFAGNELRPQGPCDIIGS